jgi:hypothetical protein
MSVQASDIKFKKSVVVTDTNANGGRKGQVEVISGARHNLFPRVTKAERVAGVTKYRKENFCNENAADDTAYDLMLFLEFPSNGGDHFALGEGTQIDTQGDLATSLPSWLGVGQLNTALTGGETTVKLDMEADDFVFPNGGYLHISNKFETGQTVDADVGIGDSCEYGGGTWSRIAATDDITHPNGLYVGGNVVMTNQITTNEEWPQLKDNLYTDEDIGDGDGANATPALTTLAHNTNGICSQSGILPVITSTCGGGSQTVNVAADGSCSGDCSAGELNMVTGVWTTDITWTSAPTNATDITATYRENCFLFALNTVTIYLEDQIANAYTTAKSYGAGCLFTSEVTPVVADWVETSVDGTYDEAGHPVTLYNDGTEQDTITITFTNDAGAFSCSGANDGSMGNGSTGGDFSPTNPDTGQPFFTLAAAGWGGTWLTSDTSVFSTAPASYPIWWKETVPSATAVQSDNLCVLGFYCE